MKKRNLEHIRNMNLKISAIFLGLLLSMNFGCGRKSLSTEKASEAVKLAFSLTEQDAIEILGITEETINAALTKFKVNGNQVIGKMRKYDRGWQLDEVQNELAAWLPIITFIRQIEEKMSEITQKVKNQWNEVENVYLWRAELVSSLVETIRQAGDFDEETLAAVIEARTKLDQAQAPADEFNPITFSAFQGIQEDLSMALYRLFFISESYPHLKALENFKTLRAQLEITENRIVVERLRYNEVALEYNRIRADSMANLLGKRISEMPLFKAKSL